MHFGSRPKQPTPRPSRGCNDLTPARTELWVPGASRAHARRTTPTRPGLPHQTVNEGRHCARRTAHPTLALHAPTWFEFELFGENSVNGKSHSILSPGAGVTTHRSSVVFLCCCCFGPQPPPVRESAIAAPCHCFLGCANFEIKPCAINDSCNFLHFPCFCQLFVSVVLVIFVACRSLYLCC